MGRILPVCFHLCPLSTPFFGDVEIFQKFVASTFECAKTGFEISLGLTGVMTLWLGPMKVGKHGGGIIAVFARVVGRHPSDVFITYLFIRSRGKLLQRCDKKQERVF